MGKSTCLDYILDEPFLSQQIKFITEISSIKKNIVAIFLEKTGYLYGLIHTKPEEIYNIIKDIKLINIRKKDTVFQKIIDIKSELENICNELKRQNKNCYFSENDFRPLIIATLIKNYVNTKLLPVLLNKKIEDLIINPHLATLLGYHKVHDDKILIKLIRFELMQHITRSIVTSWGNFVEKLLYYSGLNTLNSSELKKLEEYTLFKKILESKGENKKRKELKGANFDLVKIKNNKLIYCYWFQIKSGPNTLNQQMAEDFIKIFKLLKDSCKTIKKVNNEFLLGLTYGNKDILSHQTKSFINEGIKVLIGRELWDFIAEKENFYREVLELIDIISKSFFTKTFNIFEYIDNLAMKLKEEWIIKYGTNANLWDLFM